MHNVPEYTQKEGTLYSTCGVCVVLSPEQTEDRDTDLNNGSMTTEKQKTEKVDSLFCSDGLLTHNIENPNGIMDVQKNIC